MRVMPSTKGQNSNWAYVYFGIGGAMMGIGIFNGQFLFVIFGGIMIGLGSYRTGFLSNRLG